MATVTTGILKPARLEIDLNSESTAKLWKHWKRTFENFSAELEERREGTAAINKLRLLTNYLSADAFEFIEDCDTYENAIKVLEELFVKTPNEIFARHLLATRKQQKSESLDEYMQALQLLSKNCQCKAVSGEEYRKELCRDAFINGLSSQAIRQRLLENKTLDLQSAFDQAKVLDRAYKNALVYTSSVEVTAAVENDSSESTTVDSVLPSCNSLYPKNPINETKIRQTNVVTMQETKKCYFCGYKYHKKTFCPARFLACNNCGKTGHFAKVCKANCNKLVSASLHGQLCAMCPDSLSAAALSVYIADIHLYALVDSGSTDNYISEASVQLLKLPTLPSTRQVSMAQTCHKASISGFCNVDIVVNDKLYKPITFGILKELCSDIILGQKFQKQHKRLVIKYGGKEDELVISKSAACALPAVLIPPETLFPNLPANCKPIAVKSRRYSKADRDFIDCEVETLARNDVIEPSRSPWRAQIVIVRTDTKTRMCVDYSQTINLYTELDAYPFPRIDELVNELANYAVFSKYDLKSAYHQILIMESDRKYTAFEANGKLWQYKRIPFGVTNGGINFQRAINRIIEEENLKGVYAYQDDVTVCGRNQEEHDRNVEKLLKTFKRRKLTFNESKTVKSVMQINVLGYQIQHKVIRPDPERMKPLQNFPLPQNKKALQRVLGMLAYYSKWIPKFSEKIKPLAVAQTFPLNSEACSAFENLKEELMGASIQSIDETMPFVVECDASDVAVSATLNQGGRPVAFMSRMLQGSELLYPAVEKEATAIIEATRKWKDLLQRQHFELVTDQQSVAFMLDNRRRTKIKNNKIQSWRLELASLSYSIRYRPGKFNAGADSLTRAFAASITQNCRLEDVHNQLCHPGITRMLHFVRSKNLPFSTEDVRKVCMNCRVCAECKPRFHQLPDVNLVQALRPLQRISIDFKGP